MKKNIKIAAAIMSVTLLIGSAASANAATKTTKKKAHDAMSGMKMTHDAMKSSKKTKK